ADREVLAQKLRDACFAKRFGGDDIGADRHDARAQFATQLADVRVTAQRDEFRAYLATSRLDDGRLAETDLNDLCVFENLHAGLDGRARQAERVIQRMQMAG